MYPYIVTTIQADKLYDIICTCEPGARVYINEFTYITVHKETKIPAPVPMPGLRTMKVEIVEAAPTEPVMEELAAPEEAGRSAEQAVTQPAVQEDDDRIHCANPKCPWPDEVHDKKDMTEYDGGFFCILDCAQEARGTGGRPEKNEPKT